VYFWPCPNICLNYDGFLVVVYIWWYEPKFLFLFQTLSISISLSYKTDIICDGDYRPTIWWQKCFRFFMISFGLLFLFLADKIYDKIYWKSIIKVDKIFGPWMMIQWPWTRKKSWLYFLWKKHNNSLFFSHEFQFGHETL